LFSACRVVLYYLHTSIIIVDLRGSDAKIRYMQIAVQVLHTGFL
jgi:hypothetical protein